MWSRDRSVCRRRCWYVLLCLLSVCRPEVIQVGYLTNLRGHDKHSVQGLSISGAMTYAIEQVNNRSDLLPGHTINLTFSDTLGDTLVGTRLVAQMICSGTVAFFGPENSCLVEGSIASSFNLPMFSYKCADDNVLDESQFSTFIRYYPPQTQVSKSVVSLIKHYKWRKFSVVYMIDSVNEKIAASLRKIAEKQSMKINDFAGISTNLHVEDHMEITVGKTWARTRVYVFLGKHRYASMFMKLMKERGMERDGYVLIYVDNDYKFEKNNQIDFIWGTHHQDGHSREEVGTYQCRDFEHLNNVLIVRPSIIHDTDLFSQFKDKVYEYNKKPPFNFRTIDGFKKHVSVLSAYLYDSVLMYAHALNATLSEHQTTPALDLIRNGSLIIAHIKNKTFPSVLGQLNKVDADGESEGNFTVLKLRSSCKLSVNFSVQRSVFECDYCFQTVAVFQASASLLPEFVINDNVTIEWAGNHVPLDEPACGYNNYLCQGPPLHRDMVAAVLGMLLSVVAFTMFFMYRLWKEKQQAVGWLWQIDEHDLLELEQPGQVTESRSRLSLVSGVSLESRAMAQTFATTAIYKRTTVRVKLLVFDRKVEISRNMMKELRIMRELRHVNVNPFNGLVVGADYVKIVTDYCVRSSLPDILEGGDTYLEYMFIAELILDLIKGMSYLHTSPLQQHGNLRSSNCVITSRWVLKLTDFGLHELKHLASKCSGGGSSSSSCTSRSTLPCTSLYHELQHNRDKLWRSPEVLRLPDSAGFCGSQQDDVYAFGVILREILSRDGPYGHSTVEPSEIVERVRKLPVGDIEPFRPPVHNLNPPKDMPTETCKSVVDCMKQCWSEDPNDRPSFSKIKKMLSEKLRVGRSSNLVNSMMEKMEKYANNLEGLVRERTQLLNEEKLKSEALLHRMLPREVASLLVRGVPVQPETFDCVTIYFSDIVGFTNISACSTPLQVVEMLNDLYTMFDDIIRGYDVYKVETIGDAYMVVSGAPNRNGILHAGEVASMALSLLEGIRRHTVQHRPGDQLRLRIGIHSGPVVTGVVGLTMPRYCLFGDTVNTASRLESSGEQLRVHISDSCKQLLDQLGGYETSPRGLVQLKGRGTMYTHWLLNGPERLDRRRQLDLSPLQPLFQPPTTSHQAASRPCDLDLMVCVDDSSGGGAADSWCSGERFEPDWQHDTTGGTGAQLARQSRDHEQQRRRADSVTSYHFSQPSTDQHGATDAFLLEERPAVGGWQRLRSGSAGSRHGVARGRSRLQCGSAPAAGAGGDYRRDRHWIWPLLGLAERVKLSGSDTSPMTAVCKYQYVHSNDTQRRKKRAAMCEGDQ